MHVDLRPSFIQLRQFQVFLNGCFQVLEVFKKLVTIIFKMMLIKMGPSNEDIWILDFGILDVALNNGNLFGQW
jgi:hypothetical protein